MLEIIIEIFLEFLLQIVGELFVELFIRIGASIPWVNKAASNLLTALVLFAVGLFIGWVSLWIFPRAFVRSEGLHGISLVVTPVMAGLAMAALGLPRERWGKPMIRL